MAMEENQNGWEGKGRRPELRGEEGLNHNNYQLNDSGLSNGETDNETT